MERRERLRSNTKVGLLNRQLANITETLAKVSKRRDAKLTERRQASSTRVATAVQAATPERFVTSNIEILRDSFSELTISGIRKALPMNADMLCIHHPHTSLRGGHGSDNEDNPKKMLADLDQMHFRFLTGGGTDKKTDTDSDPRQVLKGLEKQASSRTLIGMTDNPKLMLADLDRSTQCTGRNHSNENDLEELRGKLTGLFASFRQVEPFCSTSDSKRTHDSLQVQSAASKNIVEDGTVPLPEECIPYAIAIILENSGYNWEAAKGWTTYLFSNGLDGYHAQQQKEGMVKQATAELDRIIEEVTAEEIRYREIDEKKRLPCRVILSNIAVDAVDEDIRNVLYQFDSRIRGITFSKERDRIKGTQVASLDMWTREAAIHASFLTKYIFGLRLDIVLAIGIRTTQIGDMD